MEVASRMTAIRDRVQAGMDILFPAGLLAWKKNEPETVHRVSTVLVNEVRPLNNAHSQHEIELLLRVADTPHAVLVLTICDFTQVTNGRPIIAQTDTTDGEVWILAQHSVRVS
jgi:hypothetical protein